MHPRRVVPEQERLARGVGTVNEISSPRRRKIPNPITPTPKSARLDGSGTSETGVAMKPNKPLLFEKKAPTICPASLMPKTCVPAAPGTSICVKLPPL
jgi:hypothetical protein